MKLETLASSSYLNWKDSHRDWSVVDQHHPSLQVYPWSTVKLSLQQRDPVPELRDQKHSLHDLSHHPWHRPYWSLMVSPHRSAQWSDWTSRHRDSPSPCRPHSTFLDLRWGHPSTHCSSALVSHPWRWHVRDFSIWGSGGGLLCPVWPIRFLKETDVRYQVKYG